MSFWRKSLFFYLSHIVGEVSRSDGVSHAKKRVTHTCPLGERLRVRHHDIRGMLVLSGQRHGTLFGDVRRLRDALRRRALP